MAVNKVIYDGRTLIDISDSTVDSSSMLSGVIAYAANGDKIVGQASINDMFAKGRKVYTVLKSSDWVQSNGEFVQTVQADVLESEYGIAQVSLSSSYDILADELLIADCITKVALNNGSVKVHISEKPSINITLEIAIIDGLTSATKSSLFTTNSEQFSFTLTKLGWRETDGTYSQTIQLDVNASDIIFGDIMLSDDTSIAFEELTQSNLVSQFIVSSGSITAIALNQAPTVDLHYVIKRFVNSGS